MCFGLPAPLMEVPAFIATSFLINTDALRLGKRLSEHRITRKNTIFSLRRLLLAAIDAFRPDLPCLPSAEELR